MPGTRPISTRPPVIWSVRVMQRHHVPHGAEPDALGARRRRDRVEVGRRHPAFLGAEMVLDREGVVEAERVGQLQLAPELFVALAGRHALLAPDMGEMGESHGR